jgi:hypothetical protein
MRTPLSTGAQFTNSRLRKTPQAFAKSAPVMQSLKSIRNNHEKFDTYLTFYFFVCKKKSNSRTSSRDNQLEIYTYGHRVRPIPRPLTRRKLKDTLYVYKFETRKKAIVRKDKIKKPNETDSLLILSKIKII